MKLIDLFDIIEIPPGGLAEFPLDFIPSGKNKKYDVYWIDYLKTKPNVRFPEKHRCQDYFTVPMLNKLSEKYVVALFNMAVKNSKQEYTLIHVKQGQKENYVIIKEKNASIIHTVCTERSNL